MKGWSHIAALSSPCHFSLFCMQSTRENGMHSVRACVRKFINAPCDVHYIVAFMYLRQRQRATILCIAGHRVSYKDGLRSKWVANWSIKRHWIILERASTRFLAMRICSRRVYILSEENFRYLIFVLFAFTDR